MSAQKFQFKIKYQNQKYFLILKRAPSETLEHIVLKLLGRLFFIDEQLKVEEENALHRYRPDLVSFDPIYSYQVSRWIECGGLGQKKLRKIISGNHKARIYILKVAPSKGARILRRMVKRENLRPDDVYFWRFDKDKINQVISVLKARNNVELLSRNKTKGTIYFQIDGEAIQLNGEF